MATWKKILLWIAGIAVVTVGGCLAVLDHLFSGLCATTVFEQIPSPSNTLKAVVFQIDCGVGSDFNTQAAIVKSSFDTADAESLPKGFFVADRDHGRVPAGITKGPEVRLHWESDNKLILEHHQLARVFRSEETQRGVTIKYQTFQ